MEIGVESYKDVVMGSPIFFLTNLRNCICERISAASEKAELADYRFNCTNTTAQSLISTVRNCREIICIFLESMLIYVMNEFSDSGGHFHGT